MPVMICISNLLPVIFDIVDTLTHNLAVGSPLYKQVVDLVDGSECEDLPFSLQPGPHCLHYRLISASRLLLQRRQLAGLPASDSTAKAFRSLVNAAQSSTVELPQGL